MSAGPNKPLLATAYSRARTATLELKQGEHDGYLGLKSH